MSVNRDRNEKERLINSVINCNFALFELLNHKSGLNIKFLYYDWSIQIMQSKNFELRPKRIADLYTLNLNMAL